MTRKSQICLPVVLLMLSATVPAALPGALPDALPDTRAAEIFPLPAELQPDVDFWVNIFTHYTTSQGVLHDNRNLAVVYERIDLAATTGRRERQRHVARRREKLQATLSTLAKGKRDNLGSEEARVLAL